MVSQQDGAHGLSWLFAVAFAIGIAAGVVAWLFRLLIAVIHNLAFLGSFSTVYDANQHTLAGPWGPLIIFVPVLGGLVVVWLIKNFAPEAKGHGVPEVISAIHYKRGRINGTVSLIKALASAMTIGTGGSLGREGPIVQIGAAFSSAVAQWFGLPPSQRVVLIACGASGGIAATFNAPLAGILFSIELLLVSVNSRTILPVAVSTVIAAYIGRLLIGSAPAFYVPPFHGFLTNENDASALLICIPFGVLMGLAALLFTKSVYFVEDWFEQLPVNEYAQHMLGTLILGILIYSLFQVTGHYYVQGVGYATISNILSGTLVNPWFLLAIFLAKMLATCLTIGSGGSGGIFSPSLFLGAALGGAFGHGLAALLPGLHFDPVAFAVVGMAAIVAAATSAPLTAAVITYEMTQDYEVILPVMLGVAIAYAVRRSFSETDIYTQKLLRRGENVPEGMTADIKSQLKAKHVLQHNFRLLEKNEPFSTFDGVTLVTEKREVVGVIKPFDYAVDFTLLAGDMMRSDFLVLDPDVSLKTIIRYLRAKKCDMGIVSDDRSLGLDHIVGVIDADDITAALAEALEIQTA